MAPRPGRARAGRALNPSYLGERHHRHPYGILTCRPRLPTSPVKTPSPSIYLPRTCPCARGAQTTVARSRTGTLIGATNHTKKFVSGDRLSSSATDRRRRGRGSSRGEGGGFEPETIGPGRAHARGVRRGHTQDEVERWRRVLRRLVSDPAPLPPNVKGERLGGSRAGRAPPLLTAASPRPAGPQGGSAPEGRLLADDGNPDTSVVPLFDPPYFPHPSQLAPVS